MNKPDSTGVPEADLMIALARLDPKHAVALLTATLRIAYKACPDEPNRSLAVQAAVDSIRENPERWRLKGSQYEHKGFQDDVDGGNDHGARCCRGPTMRRLLDRWAEQAAGSVTWRALIGFSAFGLFIVGSAKVTTTGYDLVNNALVLLGVVVFLLYLRNRHEALQYYRARGIDPCDRKAVKEDGERLRRKYGGS
jgi:hypothetical protein